MRDRVYFSFAKVVPDLGSNALALARFTSYDDDHKALAVEQVTYVDTGKGQMEFEMQVSAALDCGIDVSVMSPYDLDYFPKLERKVTQ
jgi:hypothetical protein|tara:strand:+ start:288 stop:551 length:264 start_codon:yes stop_codon:yes gene_type:complete